MRGRELARLRKALGLAQIDLANHLGVDRRTVIRWEADEYPVPPPMAERIDSLLHPTRGAQLAEVMALAEARRKESLTHDLRNRMTRERWKRPTY